MWNSFRTDARDGLTAEVITYPGGHGDEIHAYVVRPAGDEPVPGIVAVHHLPGWDEFYREFCDRLARHGYRVICPDLYCRFGHGTPDDVAARVRADGGVADDSVVADCAAALAWLKAGARQQRPGQQRPGQQRPGQQRQGQASSAPARAAVMPC